MWTEDPSTVNYLECEAAVSFDQIFTTQGEWIEPPMNFKESEVKPYELHTRLKGQIAALNNSEVGRLNIAIVGNQGSGKSTFLNTIATAFSYDDFVPTDPLISLGIVGAQNQSHSTLQINHVELTVLAKKEAAVRKMIGNVRVIDTIGWTSTNHTNSKIPFQGILRGNLPDGWKKDWDEESPDDRERGGYLAIPTIDDRVHGCIILASAQELAVYESGGPLHEALAAKKLAAEACGIAPILLLTKVDLVDQKLKENYQDIYESEDLCEVFNNLRSACFASSDIFLAELYHIGTERRAIIENAAMLPFAEMVIEVP